MKRRRSRSRPQRRPTKAPSLREKEKHTLERVPADAPDRAATELSSSDGAATELSSSSPALRERLIVWGLATGRGKGAHEETIRTWEGV